MLSIILLMCIYTCFTIAVASLVKKMEPKVIRRYDDGEETSGLITAFLFVFILLLCLGVVVVKVLK